MLFYLPDFNQPVLPESEAVHVLKVLRKKKGDTIWVSDGKGGKAQAKIGIENPSKCLLHIEEVDRAPKKQKEEIWLAVAPTKQMERMEWMVEKCTEIGIDGFCFIHTKRTERDTIKLDRLEKTAISAMKQSGQYWLPEIKWCPSFKAFPWDEFDHFFVADLGENAADTLCPKEGKNLIFIGPEGDFSPEEYEEIKNHSASRIRLRPQILRTETAAIFALCKARLAQG